VPRIQERKNYEKEREYVSVKVRVVSCDHMSSDHYLITDYSIINNKTILFGRQWLSVDVFVGAYPLDFTMVCDIPKENTQIYW
jgi:hypothetical protein